MAAAEKFAPSTPGSESKVLLTSACEIDKNCQRVLGATYSSEQCIFEDICELAQGACYCVKHRKKCKLQKPDPERT